jgi:hypothetical protein
MTFCLLAIERLAYNLSFVTSISAGWSPDAPDGRVLAKVVFGAARLGINATSPL